MRYDSAGVVTQVQRLASQFPLAAAAHHREAILTYRDLDIKSRALAFALKEQGVKGGSIVAICVRPGFDILVGILAIFRCNAIYLSLDPDHPLGHLKMIMDDATPYLVIKHAENNNLAFDSLTTGKFLNLDTFAYGDRAFEPETAPKGSDRDDRGQSPAYLMYTSGTTGAPKGVLIGNDNLHFYLESAQAAFRFRMGDIFCNVARYTFSISLFDLLLPLCVGASVRLIDRNEVLDFGKLIPHLQNSTVFHAGPSLLTTLFRYLKENGTDSELRRDVFADLRHVSTGGDIVLPVVMQAMRDHFIKAELYVIYGTTEISCMGTYFDLKGGIPSPVPLVGSAFPGMEALILDEHRHPADGDAIGEICFAGDGVGLGYLNKPELTDAKFGLLGTRRAYYTGDYGRKTAGGAIEMLGRRDFQAKLRGVRIELSAIENRIVALGCATQCVVVLRGRSPEWISREAEDREAEFLVAFLVGSKEPVADIRSKLAAFLPNEMMPSIFAKIEAMPVTFNGKLDRRQLLSRPIADARDGQSLEELSFLEESIASIFCSLLGLQTVGRDENFFDLGGHSLLAILLLAEVERKTGIRLSPQNFFESPTVRSIGRWTAPLGSSSEQHDPSEEGLGCSIVTLSRFTDKPAIFFLSGIHIYRALAGHLEGDWSVYGIISARELAADQSGQSTDPNSVEDLAADYVQSIIRHQAQGPYRILGYSFAGILAFEVAKQLTAAGHEVERVFLVDSTLPERVLRGRYQVTQILRLLRTSPRLLGPYFWRKLEKKVVLLVSLLARLQDRRPSSPAALSHHEARLSDIERQRGHRNRLYAEGYMKSIKRYSGEVTLFVAGRRLAKKPLRSQSCGWQRYIGYLTTIRLDADHTDMLEDSDSLARIASEIKSLAY